jgi:hypothetical protein
MTGQVPPDPPRCSKIWRNIPKIDRVKRLMKESKESTRWVDTFADACGSRKSEIVDSIRGVCLQTYFITRRALFACLSRGNPGLPWIIQHPMRDFCSRSSPVFRASRRADSRGDLLFRMKRTMCCIRVRSVIARVCVRVYVHVAMPLSNVNSGETLRWRRAGRYANGMRYPGDIRHVPWKLRR